MKHVVLMCTAVAVLGLGPQDRPLQPGDLAPDFSLPGSDGRTHSLAEHRGVRPVVIAWFPKANVKT